MTADAVILREDHGPVRVLSLNRPGLHNAWGQDMKAALKFEMNEANEDHSVRCCIITGVGDKSFTSGANLKDEKTHSTPSVDDYLADLRPVSEGMFFRDMLTLRKPLIGAVNGYAIGAGFLIAICCDIILVSENARFRMAQASLGLLPGYGGAGRLAQWVGRGRAMEICLSGRTVEATEAKEIGLAASVHAPSELMGAAMELAATLSEMPPMGLALTKESLNISMETGSLATESTTDLYRYLALTLTGDAKGQHSQWRESHGSAAS